MSEAPTIDERTFCEVHPDRETSLRCNKCGRYMCPECAVSTPVGYRCKQCVRQHEDKFFNASQNDYIIIFAVCTVLSAIAFGITSRIGIPILIMVFIAIPVGTGISELALRSVQRRRGRQSAWVGVAGVLVGMVLGIIGMIVLTVGVFPPLDILGRLLITDIGNLLFAGLIAYFVYNRFKMRM